MEGVIFVLLYMMSPTAPLFPLPESVETSTSTSTSRSRSPACWLAARARLFLPSTPHVGRCVLASSWEWESQRKPSRFMGMLSNLACLAQLARLAAAQAHLL